MIQIDRENVIVELTAGIEDAYHRCHCGLAVTMENALSLLKAQEPKFVPDIAEVALGHKPKVKVGHCPSCGVLMYETDKFCRKCGQAVKWE